MSGQLQTIERIETSADCSFEGIILYNTLSSISCAAFLFPPVMNECFCSGGGASVRALKWYSVWEVCVPGLDLLLSLLLWDIMLYGINSLLLTVHITYYRLIFYVICQACPMEGLLFTFFGSF